MSALSLSICIAMEFFFATISKAISDGTCATPYSEGGLLISHLLFADDVMIFGKASGMGAENLKSLLFDFELLTGLGVNCRKSAICFSNCSASLKSSIMNSLAIEDKYMPIKYLGIPLIPTRMKMEDCRPILDTIRNALFGWKTATLSFAGRLELLKSVVSSFHLFWSSCFLLPKQCIYLIEKHCRNFFWGCFENESKMKMVSWDNICKPFDRGGLGIVSIKSSAEGPEANLEYC